MVVDPVLVELWKVTPLSNTLCAFGFTKAIHALKLVVAEDDRVCLVGALLHIRGF